MLYNPRLDKFTREYALQLAAGVRRSTAAVRAAEAAGYPRRSSPEAFASNARKRAARPDVQARVAELMAPALAKAQAELDATVERVTRNLVQILECPLDPADVRAADHIAAVRVLADLHGWNAPKKVAPTNPTGDGPATVRHELDLTKLTDEQLDALEQILAVASGETVAGSSGA